MADFGYGGSPGEYLYGDQPYNDFANLSNAQAGQSLNAGERAASLSDPFAEQRKREIERLRLLEENPGSITSSPFFQFLRDQQMNAVNSSNAARGLTKSGRGAMALQDRAAGVASQAYFPLLQNASMLATSGSSPTAAGVTYERGIRASQDQAQMGAASRAAARARPSQPQQTAPVAPAPAASPAPSYNAGFGMPYSNANGYGYTDTTTPGYCLLYTSDAADE